MKYEARLWAREWAYGSGWITSGDVLESWDDADTLDFVKKAIEDKDYFAAFGDIYDSCDELEDETEEGHNDVKYTMEIVEIDDDDVFEEGRQIAKLSVWGSELYQMRNED